MTGRRGPSAMVAALFALHPLQVDSVAWIAERKNVLSTFFGLLCLWAYARYAEGRRQNSEVQNAEVRKEVQSPRSKVRSPWSWSVVWSSISSPSCFFALGLMSKPMLVTLPFVLLLLDYWPLRRFQPAPSSRTLRSQVSSLILHPSSFASREAPLPCPVRRFEPGDAPGATRRWARW